MGDELKPGNLCRAIRSQHSVLSLSALVVVGFIYFGIHAVLFSAYLLRLGFDSQLIGLLRVVTVPQHHATRVERPQMRWSPSCLSGPLPAPPLCWSTVIGPRVIGANVRVDVRCLSI
jgi:hypothetical protein